MKQIFCITFFFVFAFNGLAQYSGNVEKSVSQDVIEILKKEMVESQYKGQYLKGRRNGMGYGKEKKEGYYIGDYYRNEMSGLGMFISNNDMLNCEGSTIYVGNWKEGKKNGKGICYGSDGRMIYQGMFADDVPVDDYPSKSHDEKTHFSIIKTQNGEIYFGETKENKTNGFGVIVFPNGDMWQSSFKNGAPHGIGLYLTANGEWETQNKKGEDYEVISSSQGYAHNKAVRAQINGTTWDALLSGISQSLQSFADKYGQGNSNGSYGATGSYDYNKVGGTGGSSLQAQYNNWERRAKANYESLTNLGVRYARNGKNVGGSTGKGMSSSNYTMQKRALREAQQEMARIRSRARAKGITIVQSQYETVTVKY